MVSLRSLLSVAAIGFAALLPCVAAPARASAPTVAVSPFSSAGVGNWWGSNVDPGAALADLVSDRLVNAGSVAVVDRDHIDQIMREHRMAESGDVTPDSEAQLGRMLGVRYLVVGRIIEFDRQNTNSGGIGGLGRNIFGRVGGGVGTISGTKTLLHVSVKVLEVNSARIVQVVDDTRTTSATSFGIAGVGAGAGGIGAASYRSQDFQNSAMGKLLTASADSVIKQIDFSRIKSGGGVEASGIHGRVLSVEGGSIILNVGSQSGIQEGMMLQVFTVKTFHDPDSGKTIRTEIPQGTIQVVTVEKDSAIAKRVSGSVQAFSTFRAES